MLHVQKYLLEKGLEALKEEHSIKVKEYPDEGLLVLNYNQIDSPKNHPVINECRGLILETKSFEVVSRSFDRFFNYGECPETQSHIDMSKAVLCEKVDGSLIKIYHYKDEWHISTRGTAFAESSVGSWGITFKEMVLKALQMVEEEFQWACKYTLHKNYTYICEVVGIENRIVKRYNDTSLYFLAARHNKTGEIHTVAYAASAMGMCIPKSYYFSSVDECLEVVKNLKDLDEGYVLYQDDTPVCKIKSPAYVAVHHIRGEGLNPKRIAQLVLTGEEEEYLTYFPEDRDYIEPYANLYDCLKIEMGVAFNTTYLQSDTQKDFALKVKDMPWSAVMFAAKKFDIPVKEAFEKQSDAYKLELLLDHVKENTGASNI